jgi:AraC-like DNA-binding protein
MLGEALDASSAAYQVGYDDASHFNREYKRLFGLPPMRDVKRLKATAAPTTVSTKHDSTSIRQTHSEKRSRLPRSSDGP